MQAFESRLESLDKQIEVRWFDAGYGYHFQEKELEHLEHKLQIAYQILEQRPIHRS